MGGSTFSDETLSASSPPLRCTSRKYPRTLRISLAIAFLNGILLQHDRRATPSNTAPADAGIIEGLRFVSDGAHDWPLLRQL
jgi:hypothetical protein